MAGDIGQSQAGTVATVVIDQPERRNALSRAMWQRLGATFAALSADHDLRCVILRGAGEAAFSAGADISEFEETRGDAAAARGYEVAVGAAMEAVASCRHPVIAEIHGVCVGGGLELAICADLRICGESSRFAIPSARLGLALGYGELDRALALIGPSNLKEMLFEMAPLDARHALRIGLVNRVVPDAEVAARAAEAAAWIAAGAPLTHRFHKRALAVLEAAGRRLEAVPRPVREEVYGLFDTDDFREGRRAFLDKRRPVFQGR